MFQHTIEPFGSFEKHRITDETGAYAMEITPDRGACLLSLRLGGEEILDGYQTPQEVDFNRWAKNMPLFPFPNRLRDGVYTWHDQEYLFPIDDATTGNAIHGFGMECAFALADLDLNDGLASVSYVFPYDGGNPAYPFPGSVRLDYQIRREGAFQMEMAFTNESDQNVPLGMGFHPYFRLGDRADEYVLALPPCEMIGMDERMLPTGKRYRFDDFAGGRPLHTTVLDNCFALTDPGEGRFSVEVSGPAGHLHYWQETGRHRFNFIQLFTPPHRSSLAIEPMTCNVDAFNNKEGLIRLAPGHTATAKWGLHWTSGQNKQ
jgi:aldose 1-epimerase